ncbi:aminodeoxychorismate synthase component I [Brachybacterium sp. AOP43-C2-M15]|uniref:aminodeoxychorismate synthase component I n=1 Tax=Brachybacterium sp. AOP43-C2-M15 TaxID=3457661 RepID=UPI004033C195
MTHPAPVARFDDVLAGRSLQFSRVRRVIDAHRGEDVLRALVEVEEAVARGSWAVGMIAYEAATGLDPDARTRPPQEGLPLVWFGLADAPDEVAAPLTTGEGFALEPWTVDWSRAAHALRVEAVRAAIAEGETYQCNLTTRLRSTVSGDPFGLYGELAHRQRGAHHAYLDLGRFAVVSASPESFLEREGAELRTAPMKGTAARGEDARADRAAREALRTSGKDRAENVMIVDLLRNDLARVCEPGSVQVTDLLRAEAYPTLWQLTSRVRGRAREGTGLLEVLRALFPCGSITGAPKLSTMELIAELEDAPRGVYCGAIGYLAPGPAPRARFSVAIRTVLVDREDGSAVYGAGGGVTWDSTPAGEYDELLVKAAVLPTGVREPFALIETFAVRDGVPQNLAEHRARMLGSAAHFAIPVGREELEAAFSGAVARAGGADVLVRLALRRDGSFEISTRPPAAAAAPVRLALDEVRTVLPVGLSAHKTTVRGHFTAARGRHPSADDVVLRGEHGRAVETTIATLAARIDGTWCTPPLVDGCLDGVGRRLALAAGELVERPLEIEDLRRADELAVLSSARGWRPAVLAEG